MPTPTVNDLVALGMPGPLAEQVFQLGYGSSVSPNTTLLLTPPTSGTQVVTFGANTVDGTDTCSAVLSGSVSFANGRSGSVRTYGNEAASVPGWVDITLGDVSGAQLRIQGANANSSVTFRQGGGNTRCTFTSTGNISMDATNGGSLIFNGVSQGIQFKTGSNARIGTTAAMTGTPGSVVVANTSVTANSVILVARRTTGGTLGHVNITVSAGVSFTITSSANETSTFDYVIFEKI